MGSLTSLFRAATPENPNFNINSPEAWDTFLTGSVSSSGMAVTSRTALCYAPVWRAVNLLSRDVAKLPIHVYKRMGEGKDEAPEHPAYRLLHRRPNPVMTAFVFKQTLQAHTLTRGNGYAYIMRQGNGQPEELWPLDPDMTEPMVDNGVVWYITEINGEKRKLQSPDVLHIKGLGGDGLRGYDPVTLARESFGLGLATEKYGAVFFGNSARPGVVLLHPDKLADNAKRELRESWERMHQGLDRAHRTAILDRGLTVKELTISAENAQYIETRAFQIRDVANWFGVPPHKVGDTTRTAYASLEQENQAYLDDGLDPWLVAWEEECREKLLSESEKDANTHVIEFVRQALVRANLTDRGNYYRTALGGRPWMSQNEVRGRENLNPVDGGEEILDPLNMGDAGGVDNEEEPSKGSKPTASSNPRPATRAALCHVLQDAARRVVRRVEVSALRASKDPKNYLAWLERYPGEQAQHLESILGPSVLALFVESDSQGQPPTVGELVQPIWEALSRVADLYTASKLPEGVQDCMVRLYSDFPSHLTSLLSESPP